MGIRSSTFFGLSIATVLFTNAASANTCVLRSWTSPGLPAAQTGLPNGNCHDAQHAATRAACEAWCDSKLAVIQGQVTTNGPVQYPMFCVWDGTYINGCNSANAGVAISGSDKVYSAPEKCSTDIRIDDVSTAAAERWLFSELSLPPDQLAMRVMERATVAWGRNCPSSINSGYSAGLIFWHYFINLNAAKTQSGAVSVSISGSPSVFGGWQPLNQVLKSNQEIYNAANGNALDPAYQACVSVRTAPTGPSVAEIQLCKATPAIDEAFDLAAGSRFELSPSSLPSTYVSNSPALMFPGYLRKLAFDIVHGGAPGAYQNLKVGLFKNWATDDRSSTRCIFPRAVNSYNITGCPFLGVP